MDRGYAVNDYKVSIIIPVYNVSDYIEGCISSVMRQTYTNIECIIVDDATPDDSIEKCKRLIANYQGSINFEIIHQEKNRGQSAARNKGIDLATGEYVYFLDSDDEITPDCIEKLMAPLMKDPTIEMAEGNFVWIKKAGEFPKPVIDIPVPEGDYKTYENVRECYLADRMPYVWNKLIRKSFLNQNQLIFKEGILWEDVLWLHFFAKKLRHIYLLPDVTYLYYRRPHSTTTGLAREEKIKHYAIVYDEITNNLTSGEEDKEALLYLPPFCDRYLVSRGDSRLQHAYSVFYKVLSDRGHQKALRRLKTVRFISEHTFTLWLFEMALRIYHFYQDVTFMKK